MSLIRFAISYHVGPHEQRQPSRQSHPSPADRDRQTASRQKRTVKTAIPGFSADQSVPAACSRSHRECRGRSRANRAGANQTVPSGVADAPSPSRTRCPPSPAFPHPAGCRHPTPVRLTVFPHPANRRTPALRSGCAGDYGCKGKGCVSRGSRQQAVEKVRERTGTALPQTNARQSALRFVHDRRHRNRSDARRR